jgi:hypothetical protein
MDLIVDLPKSKSFDLVFVVLDRLTKMAHFVPCNKTIRGKETARLFLENVYKYHGLPDDIISDRATQFMSKFWQSLFKILQVKTKSIISVSSSNGWTNRTSESSIRAVFKVLHQLPSRQLGGSTSSRRVCLQQYISRVHPPTPFFANYGYHPQFDSLNLSLAENPAAQDLVTRLLEIHKDMKARLIEAQER